MAVLVAAMVLGSAAIVLVGFALYLAFCAFVVVRTGGTSGLRDVAIAVRAFASVGSLSSRWRTPAPPPPTVEPDQVPVPKPSPAAVVIPPPANVAGGINTSTGDISDRALPS